MLFYSFVNCLDYDLTISIMNVLQNNNQKKNVNCFSKILFSSSFCFFSMNSFSKLCKIVMTKFDLTKFLFYFIIFFSNKSKWEKQKQKQKKRRRIYEWKLLGKSPYFFFLELVLLILKQQMTRVLKQWIKKKHNKNSIKKNDINLKCHFGDLIKWTK